MAKSKIYQRQTMIYKTLHETLKTISRLLNDPRSHDRMVV